MLCLCSCSSWRWACQGPKHVEDNVTYMFILKCALKLVLKISYTMMHGRKNIKHCLLVVSQKLFHKMHANIWICQHELNCSSTEMIFLMLKLYFQLLNYLVLLSNYCLITSSLSIQLYWKLSFNVIIIINYIFYGIQQVCFTFRGPCTMIYSYDKANEMHYFSTLFR